MLTISMKYKGKYDANVYSLKLKDAGTINAKRQKYRLQEYNAFMNETLKMETKREVKDTEFSINLEKVGADSMIDLKVSLLITSNR